MIAVRRSSRLFLTLAAELAAVWSLTTVGARPELALPRDHLGTWLQTRPPADVLVALLRGVALVGAWWLLAGTVLYAVAAASRIPGALRAVRWATLPAVRRVVDAAFAASLVTGAVLAPTVATAATAATATTTADDRRTRRPQRRARVIARGRTDDDDRAQRRHGAVSRPRRPRRCRSSRPRSSSRPATASGSSRPSTSPVRPADHRGAVADVEIAPYWARVCDHNRDSLRSGDPNLVFPGERVTMPPLN